MFFNTDVIAEEHEAVVGRRVKLPPDGLAVEVGEGEEAHGWLGSDNHRATQLPGSAAQRRVTRRGVQQGKAAQNLLPLPSFQKRLKLGRIPDGIEIGICMNVIE